MRPLYRLLVAALLAAPLLVAAPLSAQITKADAIRFNPSTDRTDCITGRFELWATASKLRACENGVLHDLIGAGGALDLSNYSGTVLLISPNGYSFIGVDDTLGALGGGDGTHFSSVHTWATGDLAFGYGDGTSNGGEGWSATFSPVTGAMTMSGDQGDSLTGGVIFGGPAASDSLILAANSTDGHGNGNTAVAGPYIKIAGSASGGNDGSIYEVPGAGGSVGMQSHSGNQFFDMNDTQVRIYALDTNATITLSADAGVTTIGGVKLTPTAAPPRACAAGTEGTVYSDTSHALCFCDGTTWNKLTGSGAGTCS